MKQMKKTSIILLFACLFAACEEQKGNLAYNRTNDKLRNKIWHIDSIINRNKSEFLSNRGSVVFQNCPEEKPIDCQATHNIAGSNRSFKYTITASSANQTIGIDFSTPSDSLSIPYDNYAVKFQSDSNLILVGLNRNYILKLRQN